MLWCRFIEVGFTGFSQRSVNISHTREKERLIHFSMLLFTIRSFPSMALSSRLPKIVQKSTSEIGSEFSGHWETCKEILWCLKARDFAVRSASTEILPVRKSSFWGILALYSSRYCWAEAELLLATSCSMTWSWCFISCFCLRMSAYISWITSWCSSVNWIWFNAISAWCSRAEIEVIRWNRMAERVAQNISNT